MRMHPRSPFLPRTLATIALAATLGLTGMVLTQCRAINDPVTGVDLRTSPAFNGGDDNDGCKRQCKERYKECRRQENLRHKAAEHECDQLADEDDRERCEDAEEELHDRNIDACKAAKKQCKKDCRYHEGSGIGGR